jgi:uncharacterized membrane protein YgdD (TMEM256/DUF423 family)
MARLTKLTTDEMNQLADALQDAIDRDNGVSWRNGSHFILIHTLATLGYSAHSSEQAEQIAERVLQNG